MSRAGKVRKTRKAGHRTDRELPRSVAPVPAHGGNLHALALAAGVDSGKILDFSANINPLGPPEWLRPVVSSSLSALSHYPDPDNTALVEAVATRYGARNSEVLCGNGSTELLYLLPRALQIKRAIVPVPSYADYAAAADQAGAAVTRLPLPVDRSFALDVGKLDALLRKQTGRNAGPTAVLIGRPNNPTGGVCDAAALRKLAAKHRATFFIIDEAFGDFVEDFDSLTRKRPANVIVLCSLTKTFCVPGLRIGVAVADANVVRRVRAIQPPWSVNTLAQAVGAAALQDADYVSRTRTFVAERRAELRAALRSLAGITVFDGQANYLLVRLDSPLPPSSTKRGKTTANGVAAELARRLLKHDIAIRVCANFAGLDERYFRVAVRTAEENERLCDGLRAELVPQASCLRPGQREQAGSLRYERRARTLMFQGTSSDAGKSVMTAALCRILLQDGYRVAPFKSQNMSLNSFVTRDGGEMGRAQVVQAQACRIEPDVRMNPILLKPNSDTGSQVIVNGKPVGNMSVGQYIRYKPEAFRAAQAAFDSLAAEYDVVVLEGAGSPGEVNLKRHDIVNMGMARYANAPVLLVGDIDRGGVFASFVGTMEVLAEWERALVAGFIVNRFRGKESLLGDALDYTLRHTGKPVLGVVPYLRELGLPEEDSVSFKNGAFDDSGTGNACVEIAVVDLPHISNFTDFDALRVEPDVRVRIVRSAADINSPDAIVLPGSKNVIGDIEHLRRSGLAVKITEAVAAGRSEVVGICGGFQILGEKIADPHHIESSADAVGGLGLLPLHTTMALGKTLTRAGAKHLPSGLPLRGYEIHHGQTDCLRAQPVVRREDGEVLGAGLPGGLVWGTYLHGTFDTDEFRRWFVDRLRVRKGLKPLGQIAARYDLEPALDRLADVVRHSVKMDAIYKLLGVR